MGFRNPVTSAAAVDTGQPAGAAARLYEGSDAVSTFGVLEFRDGISGDLPATVTGRAALVPQGGGGYTQQGGQLVLDSGKYLGIPGPELLMQVASALSHGGYEATTYLTSAGGFYVNSQPWAQQRVWWFPRTGNASDPFAANVYTDIVDDTISNAPAGDYLITCDLHLSGSVAAQAFVKLVLANNAAAPAYEKRDDVSTVPTTKSLTFGLTNFAGGTLRVAGWAFVAAGTGTVTSAGTAITVIYLGPRT